jgi:hypothetical protein
MKGQRPPVAPQEEIKRNNTIAESCVLQTTVDERYKNYVSGLR